MDANFPEADSRSIFGRALEISSPAKRSAFLEEACRDNALLRAEVESLLSAHAAGDFLGSPAVAAPAAQEPTEQFASSIERPGTVIGPYKLLQQLGEGGMGVVYMAEQQKPVQRKVALKIIRPGMDTRQVIARFEAERQALALMDHPSIARVLDAGTTDEGRPYFVMELVRGVPITEYCDEHHLSPRERLELFVPVCQAVQHAHQKGIIHRDLKPSNVLIAPYDGQPVPKVIDFGVAKATGQKLTERTMFTEFGAIVGTLEYMSPEQAELNQLDIDTRSDVYSLGVLLYELLAGTTPFDKERLRSAAFHEMLRIIREEEPPKPSTRLSSVNTLPTVAANRGIEPRKLSGLLRGELDWIVMKCLEKDRSRRYETANGLAKDIERFLGDEPVQAGPPSAAYRVRKFVRRNRASVIFAALIFLALLGGVAASSWQAVRATRAEGLAATHLESARKALGRVTAEAAKATTISDFLLQMIESGNPEAAKGSAYTVRQMLDDFSPQLTERLRDQPEAAAAINATMGNAYRRLGALDKAEPYAKAALELRERVYGRESVEVADSLVDYAWVVVEQGDCPRAEDLARQARAIEDKLGLPTEKTIKSRCALTYVLYESQQWNEEWVQASKEIVTVGRRDPAHHAAVADVLHRLAFAMTTVGNPPEGERLARESVELHRQAHGNEHPETAWGLSVLGDALRSQQKLDEARECYREAVEIFRKQYRDVEYPELLSLVPLALIAKAQDDQKSLAELGARAEEFVAQGSSDWKAWRDGAHLCIELGQRKNALQCFTKQIELCPPSNPQIPVARYSMALLQLDQHDVEAYRATCQAALEHGERATDANSLGVAAMTCTSSPDSGVPADRVVAMAERAQQADPSNSNLARVHAIALYRAGRFEESRRQLVEIVNNSPDIVPGYFLAMSEHRLGRTLEAQKWFRSAANAADAAERAKPGDEEFVDNSWFGWVVRRLARQEAEQLLAEDDEVPASGAEPSPVGAPAD